MSEEKKEKMVLTNIPHNDLTEFDYDTGFYLLWLAISMTLFIAFSFMSSIYDPEWFHPIERLFWWFWFITSIFIFKRRNDNLVFKHNIQKLQADYREVYDAKVNVGVLEALITMKKEKLAEEKANAHIHKKQK
jgi:hypothetical protein